MPCCGHQLTRDLEEWEGYVSDDGTCNRCGVVIETEKFLRVRLFRAQELLAELWLECIGTQADAYGGKSGYFECRLCGFDFLFTTKERHASECPVGQIRAFNAGQEEE